MATIKDVARLADVSPTTVSIVINGKAKERQISEETSKRIFSAMEALNYRPNMNARRLRSSDETKPTVAFFWPMDHLVHVMSIIINDLLKHIHAKGFACEFVVQTYELDHCEQLAQQIIRNEYDAVIMGCASQEVIDYIDSLQTNCPIIFLNRISAAHSYATTDQQKMMRLTAQAVARKGCHEVGIFTPAHGNYAAERRLRFFMEACQEFDVATPQEYIVEAESTTEDGYHAMETYLAIEGRPRVIFSNSDIIALGALAACNRRGILVPDELEILAIELMDPQFSEYSIPPLTTIAMPTNEMCRHIVEHLIDRLQNKSQRVERIHCEAELRARRSFLL